MKKTPTRKGRLRRVTVTLEPADYKSLCQMAERAQLSISSFVRSMIEVHRKIERTLAAQAAEAAARRELALLNVAQEEAGMLRKATADETPVADSTRGAA